MNGLLLTAGVRSLSSVYMTEEPEKDEDDLSGKVNRLSDADYAEAVMLCETNQLGLVDLANKFGISRQGLARRFKSDGIIRGSKEPSVATAAPEAERFTTSRPTWIEETRTSGFLALKQANMLARKIVIDNVRAGGKMDVVDDQLKAVQRYNKILVDNLDATLRLLQADDFIDEEDLPVLQIEDLTDEDILNHHKSTGALDENATIEDMLQENIEMSALE